MEQERITRQEFKDWQNDKVTKAVTSQLNDIQEEWKTYLANGRTIAKDSEFSTDFVVGRIQGINDFLLADHEDVEYD